MTRICHNQRLHTNLWHYEEEAQTATTQLTAILFFEVRLFLTNGKPIPHHKDKKPTKKLQLDQQQLKKKQQPNHFLRIESNLGKQAWGVIYILYAKNLLLF